MALASGVLDGLQTELGTLEASFRGNKTAYLGTKPKNGGLYSGADVSRARDIAQLLSGVNNEPDFASDAQTRRDRTVELWKRATAIAG